MRKGEMRFTRQRTISFDPPTDDILELSQDCFGISPSHYVRIAVTEKQVRDGLRPHPAAKHFATTNAAPKMAG
jgi:hypothetical protein